MAGDAVVPHVRLENHRHLSSLVGSDETPLSDHLPQGFPLYSAVWTETGADCGDPMLKLRHSRLPTGQCVPALVIDGQSGRCSHKEVVHLKLSLLIFAVWQPAQIPSHATKHTPTHPHTDIAYWCVYKYALNRVHKYTHSKNKEKPSSRMSLSKWVTCEQCVNGVWKVALFQWLWLIAKLSLCNSYGWVPAYKIMFQSMTLCHSGGGFERQHVQTSISTCHLHLTCWTALMLHRNLCGITNIMGRSSLTP